LSESDAPLAYLGELREETMRRAWGDIRPEDRRRIVTAATIFGRQFEEQSATTSGEDPQRLLMSLMNAVVREFAKHENLPEDEAANFLSEVPTRDYILEFDEVLETHKNGGSGKTLDELLDEAVESRREKAIWSGHWSSG
jgi:hypothetical protein